MLLKIKRLCSFLLVLLILLFLLKDDDGNIDRDLLILAGVFLLVGL